MIIIPIFLMNVWNFLMNVRIWYANGNFDSLK